MSKVLSVNNGNYTVKVEGGGQILLDTARGSFVSGKPAGTVVIRGSLEVEGTTTTVESNDTLINDNILTLNNGQVGAGISASKNYQSGIEIDRGSESKASFVFDDNVSWNIGGDSGTGGFKLFTGSGDKTTLVLDGIKSNAALFIDTGNNAISVTNATDYETRVFPYTGGVVTGGAIDDDLIPNAKAVVDYVTFASATVLQDRIEEGTTSKTFVETKDFEVTGSASRINIGVDNVIKASFLTDTIELGDIIIQGSQIMTSSSNEDLRLEAAGTGSVQINDKLLITTTLQADDAAVDPTAPSTGSIIYTKAEGSGGSGVYFVNSSTTQNELISNNRSLLYSMIF
tara:strand:- start:2480 stop:3508 length:1029 start_codon:yes stop_codon:yes gene_type:complete